eukprot:27309-Pyramimonas_sp.AAC.1
MSLVGRRGGLSGKCTVPWAAWLGMRRSLKEPVIIIECSRRLKAKVVNDMLGDLYLVTWAELDPAPFGWVGRRPRFWA